MERHSVGSTGDVTVTSPGSSSLETHAGVGSTTERQESACRLSPVSVGGGVCTCALAGLAPGPTSTIAAAASIDANSTAPRRFVTAISVAPLRSLREYKQATLRR